MVALYARFGILVSFQTLPQDVWPQALLIFAAGLRIFMCWNCTTAAASSDRCSKTREPHPSTSFLTFRRTLHRLEGTSNRRPKKDSVDVRIGCG